MNYSEQLKLIYKYKLRAGESKRFNCPLCRGKNTLGISNENGKLKWHCFKSSCELHGEHNKGLSLNESKQRITPITVSSVVNLPIPAFLSNIDNQNDVLEWLKSVNSWKAYEDGLVDIKFDPVRNRILFPINTFDSRTNNVVGYSGRSLTSKPKWLKYGDCTNLFTCGNGPIAVLVEDAASACAIAPLTGFTGVSILGTSLSEQHKLQLRKFEKVIVCLDPDAAAKGLSLSKRIHNATFKQIPDDLKYYEPQEISEILND